MRFEDAEVVSCEDLESGCQQSDDVLRAHGNTRAPQRAQNLFKRMSTRASIGGRKGGGLTVSAVWWAALSMTGVREYCRCRVLFANTCGAME